MSYSTTTYPYDTVVRITDTIGGQSWQGSGVLISPDEVLTASHVVYTQGVGTANNIVVVPGYQDGATPYGTFYGTYIHYYQIADGNRLITTQQSQYDYAMIHLSAPVTGAGYMGLLSDFGGGTVDVTGYPASAYGSQVDSTQYVVSDPNYTVLDGVSIGEGSSGGPVWVEYDGGPHVVGIVSSGTAGSTGYDTLITSAALAQIEAWVQQDDNTASPNPGQPLTILDTTTQAAVSSTTQSYTGPVSGIQSQYVNLTTDNLNITASTPGWFIHSGSGNDAIAVSSGTNVLDGGTGSNFLTGGSGVDTFFVDDRGPTGDIWSTVNNFHAGDAATIWGVTPQDFTLTWADGQGAVSYTGLTLHATSPGQPTASLTLVGFNSGDLTDGRLTVSFGTTAASGGVPGSTYMYVHENS